MKNDERDLLILRYLSGELGPEEAEKLRALLESDPEAARRVLALADEELLFRKGFEAALQARRRPWRPWAAVAAILLALVGVYAFFGTVNAVARVVRVDGSGRLLPGGEPLKEGQDLNPGQGVESSGEGSGISLALADGTQLHLEANTRLSTIEEGREGKRITVQQGDVRASVARQPEGRPMVFSTAQGEAEVLGTTLRLLVDPDSKKGTTLGVGEGKVRLRNRAGKTVEVSGGHFAVAAAGIDLVVRRSAFIPPYSIPDPGDVAVIGVNRAVDVAASISTPPASMSTALFGAYGGGTFVRDFSLGGAYVLTNLGGHASPTAIAGAVLFDFEDATWKGFENSNGIASNGGGWTANSNGDPWQEWTGTEVPLPSHPYLIAAELPASRGGGPKGSVVFLGRAAVTSDGGGGRGPHALNLNTHQWSRLTSADHPRVAGIYTSVVVDEQSGRYYSIGGIEQRKDVPYYDAADWSQLHATTPQYGWPAFGGGSRSFLDPVRRLIIDFADNRELHALQLDNPGAGWSVLPVTGTLPAIPSPEPNRFVFYPPDGNFYYRPVQNGGAILHRLKPPADNPLTKPWTADQVTLTQSLPDCDSVASNGAWYSFFFYVPSIQCLGWVVGADKPVYLLKPPGDGTAAAPTITTQPAAQSVTVGQAATFSVVAAGAAPLSYQWQLNGSPIPGATSAVYTTPVTTLSNSGAAYRVIVTNSIGSATSAPATLTVTASPAAPPPSSGPTQSPSGGKDKGKCGCGTAGMPSPRGGWIAALAVMATFSRRVLRRR